MRSTQQACRKPCCEILAACILCDLALDDIGQILSGLQLIAHPSANRADSLRIEGQPQGPGLGGLCQHSKSWRP